MPVAVSGMTTLRPKVSMCRCEGSPSPAAALKNQTPFKLVFFINNSSTRQSGDDYTLIGT